MRNFAEKWTKGLSAKYIAASCKTGRVGRLATQCIFEALESRTMMSVAAPTSLAADVTGPTSVELHWTDNDVTAKGYNILRSTDGVHFTQLSKLASPSATGFTDTTALSGHNYSYEVDAYNGAVVSAVSNSAAAATPLAGAATLTATVVNPTTVTLKWVDKDTTAVGYNVLRSSDGGTTFVQIAQLVSAKAVTYTDSTASSDHTYIYKVQAYFGGGSAPASNAVTVTTPLLATSGLTAAAQSFTSVLLNWTDNDGTAAGYYVLRTADGTHWTTIANLSSADAATYTDNAAVSGHAYKYEVQAYNGSTTSALGAMAAASTPLAAPSGLVATVKGPTSVQLTWTNNDTSSAGYDILRSTDGTHWTQIGKVTGAGTTTYTDNAAGSFHTYNYEIEAYNGTIVSPASSSAVAGTPLAPPVTLVAKATGPTSILLTWVDKEPLAAGYNILRSTDGVHYSLLTQIVNPKAATYTDSSVSSNATYSYRVQAYSGGNTSDSSNISAATTPIGAPSGLTAVAQSFTSVQLNWTDNDAQAAGYYVLRSADGTHWSNVATLNTTDANSYTDNGVVSGHTYKYEVEAYNGVVTSAFTPIAAASTPLAAPSGLSTTVNGPNSVTLHWTDNDASAAGYIVLRSTNGSTYTQLTKITSASANSYTDATAPSGTTVYYKVQAWVATTVSPMTDAATATTPLVAPINVVVTMLGSATKLTWTDKDGLATGYYVLRSTDNSTYSQIAQISSPSANSYVDNTVSAGQAYYYKVEAYGAVSNSAVSASATITTPLGISGGVAITTRYGDELVITATGLDDSISITESGTDLTITADGQIFDDSAPAAGVFVYTRGGSDSVNIDASVTSEMTVDTIDGAADLITSAGSDVGVWADSTDSFSGTGDLHSVASFVGGVSKALGVSLANPHDAGATTKVNLSLWGTGPVMGDVNQGEAGDCYFLSTLAAFAGENPQTLQQSAVDLGDGTYAVQFYSSGTPSYVRVSNAFSNGGFGGFLYAHPGSNDTIWAAVMEKAFCQFRTGANTYASINSGWMGSVYANLDVNSTNIFPNTYSENAFYTLLNNALNSGKEVTFGTASSVPNLVGGHAYTLVSVSVDGGGATHYVVRNPWGVQGDAIEDSGGYATLTFAQMVANFVDGCVAA